MYASLTTVNIKPEKAHEATRIWREEILPITQTFPGWKGAELFTSRKPVKEWRLTSMKQRQTSVQWNRADSFSS